MGRGAAVEGRGDGWDGGGEIRGDEDGLQCKGEEAGGMVVER